VIASPNILDDPETCDDLLAERAVT